MRTTLDIDEDVLHAAKEIARSEGKSAGSVLSRLARKGLIPPESKRSRSGLPLLPERPVPRVITLALVNSLRDEEGDS